MAVFGVVAPCSLVDQTTRRYNPEDSHLRTHRREKLKSIYLLIINVDKLHYKGVLNTFINNH
jgi:hypothetical protein